MKVVITRRAHLDLVEIGDWIARDNPAAARRLLDIMLTACESLADQPERYPRTAMFDLRKRALGDYLIFYRVRTDVEIVRILHGARDWPDLLDRP